MNDISFETDISEEVYKQNYPYGTDNCACYLEERARELFEVVYIEIQDHMIDDINWECDFSRRSLGRLVEFTKTVFPTICP